MTCIPQQKFVMSRHRPKFKALLQAWAIEMLYEHDMVGSLVVQVYTLGRGPDCEKGAS
jgi:hypothetical protein